MIFNSNVMWIKFKYQILDMDYIIFKIWYSNLISLCIYIVTEYYGQVEMKPRLFIEFSNHDHQPNPNQLNEGYIV